MPRVFISYWREDTIAYAGRIYDRLAPHFGAANVFMDVDTLEPGVDFVHVLQRMVENCDIFLCIIGRQWLAVQDEDGRLYRRMACVLVGRLGPRTAVLHRDGRKIIR